MLKIVGLAEAQSEFVILSGYTVDIRWNTLRPQGHVFWSRAVAKHPYIECLLEIGIAEHSHILEEFTVVSVKREQVHFDETPSFSNLGIPTQFGLPICEWADTYPKPRYIREEGTFSVWVGHHAFTVCIGETIEIARVVAVKRAHFGISASNELVALHLSDLRADEMLAIKTTFAK
jgi:hypothetical protein